MAGGSNNEMLWGILSLVAVAVGIYIVDPTFFGLLNKKYGFTGTMSANSLGMQPPEFPGSGEDRRNAVMRNPNVAPTPDLAGYEGPASFGNAEKPEGCYPRDQLTPGELLPKDQNSVWSQQNPMGNGSLKGKNFLSAGALIGINTVGQSLRNANYQLRSEPPNPQVAVSVFNQSTIEADISHRPLEIG